MFSPEVETTSVQNIIAPNVIKEKLWRGGGVKCAPPPPPPAPPPPRSYTELKKTSRNMVKHKRAGRLRPRLENLIKQYYIIKLITYDIYKRS